jgi:hydrophobic/amphiphilic exporter-1 (mainly G- bacteria), HAE1 family
MQWLAEICVRRPVFATVIILSLVVVGYFGYTKLGVDRFPKVDFPIVTVVVREDGASPEEIETDVVDKVEEAVNTISGIDTLSSSSFDGVGQVAITFQLEKNIDVAVEEVRAKVNGVIPDLPLDIKAPVIDKVDPDASPILYIALSAPANIRDITEYADKRLRRQVESIEGVGQVTVIGGRKRQINVNLDPYKLRAYNLTSADVQLALANQNIQVPGGQVDQNTRKLTLRTHGRVQAPAQFDDIIIAQKNGAFIRVRDVGSTEDGTEDVSTVADLNGVPTVLLSVRKQSGLNTVATVDAVKERLAEITKALPPGYAIKVIRDQSTYIKASTEAVQEHLKVGSVLAALVVLIFLWNWRTTIISGIAIPASIISAFALMYAMGFTLNSLTLLALTLSVGIVIDDAIVVLENIYRFIEEKGMRPFEAAIEGTREIGLAVLATTLSLIAVFLPVAFMTGIVGRFLNSFGLTMAFAIFVSLIVSFTLTPMLASRWIKTKPKPEGAPVLEDVPGNNATPTEDPHPSGSKATGIFKPIDAVYTWLLHFSMRHRWVIVLLSVGALMSMGYTTKHVPVAFLPEDDESQFQITVRAAEGTSLKSMQELGDRIAVETRKLPDVEYTILTIGDSTQQTENVANIFVALKDVTKRKDHLTQQDITQMARTQVLPHFGNLRASAGPVPAFSTGAPQAQVTYALSGPDLDKLIDYSQRTVAEMKKIPGVVDADSSLVVGKPELGVDIDRQKAADLGVSVVDISNALRILVGGQKVTEYYEHSEQYEVHLRADLPYRSNEAVISQLTVPSTTNGSVPLDQVVKFRPGTGPSEIDRLNRRRNVLLTCNVLPGYSQQAVNNAIDKIIKDLHVPPGYDAGPNGTSRELAKAGAAFVASFVLAIIFMYLVLAAQFESWVHPITILIALPLTVPFAILSMMIFHQSVNIFTILGMLVLFGVVKKNGILQVDHTNQLRARGMNRYDAIIQANRDRLRPILMTTIAFVAGMVPLVLSNGTGAATNQGIGYTVIGGQTFSLLLTLLATPVFYSLFDDIITTPMWGRLRTGIEGIGRRLRRRGRE